MQQRMVAQSAMKALLAAELKGLAKAERRKAYYIQW